MCITRVGRVLSAAEGRARVEFFDGMGLEGVDVSLVGPAPVGTFVEVYGNLALSVFSPSEAKKRLATWKEVREAAIMPDLRRAKRA